MRRRYGRDMMEKDREERVMGVHTIGRDRAGVPESSRACLACWMRGTMAFVRLASWDCARVAVDSRVSALRCLWVMQSRTRTSTTK